MAISLISCSALSGFAGIVITAQVSAGSPNVGSSYLLPAYAAAFLGATQLKQGRFNVWGTVLSVYTIAAGVKGFNLVGAQAWITDVFTGAILVIAVAIPRLDRLGRGRLFGRSHTLPAGDSAPAPEEPVDRSSEQAHAER
jgi:ribose transport system permease protein